jgi:hypothetical protein
MKTLVAACMAAMFAMAARVEAGIAPGEVVCCACIGVPDGPPSGVSFCLTLTSEEELQEAEESCTAQGGGLECFKLNQTEGTCAQLFVSENITCPAARAGAPVLGPASFAALAGALGAIGTLLLRRRRSG